ncbi:MAG: hypothetical protein HQK63_17000 [Desulfamplus sp.]|nr:hypothetical protein [Desulfamplus sp.]
MVTKSVLKPASIKLSRAELQAKIDKIFEEATYQNECLVNIYKIIFPNWSRIDKIHGYPVVGCKLWLYICKKFIEFNAKHHPECTNGIWLNNGFSSSRTLKNWEIDMSQCSVTYYN